MSINIITSVDHEITKIRNTVIDRITNEEYWRNQHEITLRKCIKLNDELNYEKHLHKLTKSCRRLSLSEYLCEDILQYIYDILGINGTILKKTCKKLNQFNLNLKSVNLKNSIHICIHHLRPFCILYNCINPKYNVTYIGDCIAGMPHGKGKLNFTSNKFNKTEISGNFYKGLPNGYTVINEDISTLDLNNNIISCYNISVINLTKGNINYDLKCTLRNQNADSIYTGDFIIETTLESSSRKHIINKSGFGMEIISNTVYNGNWYLNKFHGLGKFEINGELKYNGYWSGGQPFCPELGLYGDTGTTLLKSKLLIKNGIEKMYDILIVNENKWIAYNKYFDMILNKVKFEQVGILEKNEENTWLWK